MLARDQKALGILALAARQLSRSRQITTAIGDLGLALQIDGRPKRADVAFNEAMGKACGIRTDWEWDWLWRFTAVRDQALSCAAIASKVNHPQREKHFDELVRTFGEAALVLLNARTYRLCSSRRRCRWYSHRTMEAIVKTATAAPPLSSKIRKPP